jgi:hypothetical protein
VIWVLWMIVRSLKGIDASLKEIANSSHTPSSSAWLNRCQPNGSAPVQHPRPRQPHARHRE